MTEKAVLCGICAVAVIAMFIYIRRRKHWLKTALFGSVTGFMSLLIVNRFGAPFGAELPLNAFNICGSVVLGVPFTAIMILLKYL